MHRDDEKALLARISEFAVASNAKATLEITATVGLFLVLFGIMQYGIMHGIWLAYLPLPVAAILITRLFTIQHDCGHGAYFSSARVNDTVGCILGVFTFTPYYYWRKNHGAHHASSGNLDKRGIGDVDMLTVSEYNALKPLKKAWYRLYRNPFFMLIISPFLLFGMKHRLPLDNPFPSFKSWTNIMLTNLGIAVFVGTYIYFAGLTAFLLVFLPVFWLAWTFGVGGFYIQHQYEDAYWSKGEEWKFFDAGMKGSSYFDFHPAVNWLTNHINLHHIHHLNGRVPSYRLTECLAAIPELQSVEKRTLKDVPACFTLALWDDVNSKMVGFRS